MEVYRHHNRGRVAWTIFARAAALRRWTRAGFGQAALRFGDDVVCALERFAVTHDDEGSIGAAFASGSRAQAASSYGLIVGVVSVNASRNRT